MLRRRVPSLVVLASLGAVVSAQAAAGGYAKALERYKETQQRAAFRYHTDGRERMAQTHSIEALTLLAADYQSGKNYPEYARYTLATLFGRHFDGAEFVPALTALRAQCGKPIDTWLWAQSLRAQAKVDAEPVLAIVRTDKNALHRAAAIFALGAQKSSQLPAAITAACIEFPKVEAERNALIGAMSGAIWENRAKVNDAEFRTGLKSYIELLAPALKLTHAAQLQIARHLQWVLNAPAPWIDPESWLALLERGDVKKSTGGNTVAAGSRFFGIESDGERICYVLDLSDSMCKEIDRSGLPKGPVTGPRKKREKGELPDESDIPWNRVINRFDLAREHLRISLERLPRDKYFSVVIFGDDAESLGATKGMVKATKANIDKAMAELDALKPGEKDAVKAPDGVLKGKTNLFAGMRHAFGLSDKGLVAEVAYVDPATLTDGCDTIFLLSDGAPSWDDFHVVDKDYGEDQVVVDTEYGAKVDKRPPTLMYHGPFDQPEWLLADVQRMNAFRRVRIHCIGIGEASMTLLKQLADLGHGVSIEVGKEKSDRKAGGGAK